MKRRDVLNHNCGAAVRQAFKGIRRRRQIEARERQAAGVADAPGITHAEKCTLDRAARNAAFVAGAIIAAMLAFALLTAAARGGEATPAADPAKAVCLIETISANGSRMTGSGVCVSPAGKILTVTHVVAGGPNATIRVLVNGEMVAAKSVSAPATEGVATIELGEGRNCSFVEIAGTPPVRGDPCLIVGFPGGGEKKITESRVETTRAWFGGDRSRSPLVGVASRVAPGTSGGGVFVAGKLVALVSVSELPAGIGVSGRGGGHGGAVRIMESAGAVAFAVPVYDLPDPIPAAPPAPVADAPAKTRLWVFSADWCGPCRAFKADLMAGKKWGAVVSTKTEGHITTIETATMIVSIFNTDDATGLQKFRDVRSTLTKATGETYPESIPAFYVPGRNAMQVGYASMTGCFLIDAIKSVFVPTESQLRTAGTPIDPAALPPQRYERSPESKLGNEGDPPLIALGEATPIPVPDDAASASDKSMIDKAADVLRKADAALAKAEEIRAALHGEKIPAKDGDDLPPKESGIIAAIIGVAKLVYEWKRKAVA